MFAQIWQSCLHLACLVSEYCTMYDSHHTGCQLGRGDIHKQLPDHFRTHPISRDIVNWLDTIL